jgi:ABC-type uncharacterized transport system ATPase subunit
LVLAKEIVTGETVLVAPKPEGRALDACGKELPRRLREVALEARVILLVGEEHDPARVRFAGLWDDDFLEPGDRGPR